MKLLRLALTVATLVLLVGGYAASQFAALTGQAPDYAKRIDQAPVQALSLVILAAAIVLAFMPEQEEDAT